MNWWTEKLSAPDPEYKPIQPLPAVPMPADRPSQTPKPVRQEDFCPSCHSSNYMSAPNSTYSRCFDCGYPMVQSGTGVGSTTTEKGAAKKATQVAGDGFNPSVIVGRVE